MRQHCLWCDETISEVVSWHEVFGFGKKELICPSCRHGLERLTEPFCKICGRSLEALDETFRKGDLCYDCVRWEESEFAHLLIKNRSLYHYNAFLKDVISQYKFRGDVAMVEGFRHEWEQLFHKEFQGKRLVPIPLSKERLYERGFNQAAELTALLPTACCEVLERPLHEQKQSKKSREERLHFHEGVFRLASNSSMIKGEEVVLVDDIYTTGATLRQAAKVLLAGGAASVSAMTLARG